MSKPTSKSTTETKIKKDIKSTAKFNELKYMRTCGEITPEVIEMCKQQIDEMLESAKKWSKRPTQMLEEAAEQIKNDQEMLVNVTKFMDIYDEIIAWNKLIHEKKLDIANTIHHREVDLAFFHKKVCELQIDKGISKCVYSLIYHHGHRND